MTVEINRNRGNLYAIWAEENSTLGGGSTEWAFGNGANTPANQGIVIAFKSWLVASSLNLKQGSATIAIFKNGVEVAEIVSGGTANKALYDTPISYEAGDVLGFRTKTASSTGSPNTITAWFRTL